MMTQVDWTVTAVRLAILLFLIAFWVGVGIVIAGALQ